MRSIILPVPRNLQFRKQTICRLSTKWTLCSFRCDIHSTLKSWFLVPSSWGGHLKNQTRINIKLLSRGFSSQGQEIWIIQLHLQECRVWGFVGSQMSSWPLKASPTASASTRPGTRWKYMLKGEDWMLFWACWNSLLPSARIKATKEAVCWAVTVHSLVESRGQWTP